MKKLFIIVNVDWFFLSHRLPIALRAKKDGYDVTVIAGDTGKKEEIESYGLKYIPIKLQRSGINPVVEVKTFITIFKLINRCKPDVVHNVALKTCLYGGISTRFFKNCITINAISGLGYFFTTDKITLKQRLFSKLLKLGFHGSVKSIFQNPDDLDVFKKLSILNDKSLTYLIKGSGVDIHNKYKSIPIVEKDILTVLFPARMLYTKGVEEFCLAAKIVNKRFSNIRFILVGDNDDQNLSSVSTNKLYKFEKECGVEWKGYSNDMSIEYINADIVVLPSYREGLPKSLIEACAIGRPIVTTDTPGCRECVQDSINGYLVPIKNHELLADKILKLAKDKSMRIKMGEASRKLAEREFSIDSVIEKTLALYK